MPQTELHSALYVEGDDDTATIVMTDLSASGRLNVKPRASAKQAFEAMGALMRDVKLLEQLHLIGDAAGGKITEDSVL